MTENRYKSRLGYLMDKLSVTAKELAAAVHVDHSLISKWRNNSRPLQSKSIHLEHISSYFVSLDQQLEYNVVSELLKEEFAHYSTESIKMKTEMLKRWLLVTQEVDNNEKMNRLLNTKGAYTTSFDVYKGTKGRRLASQRFMELALALPPGQEIFLFSETPQPNWHHEDRDFFIQWKKNYLDILNNGNRITLIRSLDRQIRLLISTLLEWLPMDLTGNLTSCYFSKYTDSLIKKTVQVITDKAAMYSISVEGLTKTTYTHYFTDPITILQGKVYYESLLANCRYIYQKFLPQERSTLLHKMEVAGQQLGNSYWFTAAPMFKSVPNPSLYEILSYENMAPAELIPYIAQYERIREIFLHDLQHNHCRIILNLHLFEDAYKPEFLQQESVTLTKIFRDSFCQNIRHLLKLLTLYPNFELALTNEPAIESPAKICMYVKENTITIINSLLHNSTTPITLISQEPAIINAYFVHLDNFWSSIPPVNRDRNWVNEKFKHLLHNMSATI